MILPRDRERRVPMSLQRLLAVLGIPQVVGLLLLLTYGCAISTAFVKTTNIIQGLNSEKGSPKFLKNFDLYLLPFFIPQFGAIVLHPVAVGFTLLDTYLNQTRNSSILTVLTTIATTTSNILFLLSAGTSVVITSIVTSFLVLIEACSRSTGKPSGTDCVINFFVGYFNDPELMKASITAMVALILTTLIYVCLPCSWSHILRQRRERPDYARIDS